VPKINLSNTCCGKTGDYLRRNASPAAFGGAGNWAALSPVQRRIRQKVESRGTPLKDWDISIYRGVLTGCNEAFVINGAKREELVGKSPKNADVIRPILRGRDIKRYGHAFADLWLINAHNGIREKGIKRIEIDDYPDIKEHLDQYYTQLEKRTDKGDTPYNLRNCAYTEEFFRQKIVYPEINGSLHFSYDYDGFATLQTAYSITGEKLKFLLAFLNSALFRYCFKDNFTGLGDKGLRLLNAFMEKLPVMVVPEAVNAEFGVFVDEIQTLKQQRKPTRHLEREIEQKIFGLYQLTEEEIAIIEPMFCS